MINIFLRYGGYAALALILFNLISFMLIEPEPGNYGFSEVIGYMAIVISLLFIIPGIRAYRQKMDSPDMSYWKSVLVGIGISIIPSIAFGLYTIVYISWLNPDFLDEYYEAMATSPDATAEQQEYADSQVELFSNPFFQFLIMFLTVFMIGIILSILIATVMKFSQSMRGQY